jgi:hypothetical protein
MPEERMTALARRLAADASKRYPALEPASASSGGSYRTEPWVFVVSLVVTSPLTIEDPRGEVREATSAIVRNLVALSSDATTIDVRVSGALRAAELSTRDPAMRSLRG